MDLCLPLRRATSSREKPEASKTAAMGKKKQFVDRNAAGTYTFQVVHRSQRDPRLADEDASAFVLQPVVPLNVQKRGPEISARAYEEASTTLRSIPAPKAEARGNDDDADEILYAPAVAR